jgi:hypothetical protein
LILDLNFSTTFAELFKDNIKDDWITALDESNPPQTDAGFKQAQEEWKLSPTKNDGLLIHHQKAVQVESKQICATHHNNAPAY